MPSRSGTSSTVCCKPRPAIGSVRQIASLASNRAMRAKRKASSMRGPQKALNSRRKDTQSITDCLIAIPAQANIQEVDAEWALTVGDIKVDDVGAPLERHQSQRRRSQVTVWI